MMNFPEVTEFTTTWHEMMPHVWRSGPGETDMANTNHLIQSYNGMTGLKTGFTRLAKYSLSATATRNDMSLIAVIMGAETKDQRSQDVTALLDYGFGFFTLQTVETDGQSAGKVSIIGGMQSEIDTKVQGNVQLLARKDAGIDAQNLQTQIDLSPSLQAPIQAGDPVGTITYLQDEEAIATLPVVAAESVEESTLGKRFMLLIDSWLHKMLMN